MQKAQGIPFEFFFSGRLRQMLKGRHSINSWFVGNTAPRAKATPLCIHLPSLENICLTLVKRQKLARGKQDIFPAELWQRYHDDGNLCSVCQKVNFGPAFFERLTSSPTGRIQWGLLHSRSCSLACDRAVLESQIPKRVPYSRH